VHRHEYRNELKENIYVSVYIVLAEHRLLLRPVEPSPITIISTIHKFVICVKLRERTNSKLTTQTVWYIDLVLVNMEVNVRMFICLKD
jgi:hypothetical protein